MNIPSGQTVLAAGALVILGGVGAAMLVLPIPAANAQSVTFILGALAGALTVGGPTKIATSNGPGAAVQPDAPIPNLKDPIL